MQCDLRPIALKVDILLTELSDMLRHGPRLRIIHRFGRTGSRCLPGEEIAGIFLIHRGREIPVPLSLALRLLVDFLARNRSLPQSATQIASGMQASSFYRKHGANSGVLSRRRICRSAVKEYVRRIHKALEIAFNAAPLPLDAKRVLRSEDTVGNEVHYRLQATVEWVHIQAE